MAPSLAVNVFIRQLTGIRFIAAAWVVLYHLQGPLDKLGLLAIPILPDVMRVGRLGVDLFFALSGFILTHTYLTRMGPRLAGRKTLNFWWLRLARVYPVHLVMLVVAGIAVIAQAKITGEGLNRGWLNPIDFGKNLLLVQEWGPNPQRGWNFVAWSLSMEWLAYLIFPLLILLIWIFYRRVSTTVLGIAWIVVLIPIIIYGLNTSDAYYTDNWGSTIRILCEFTAGAITYLIVRRFIPDAADDPAPRVQRLASSLSIALPLVVIVGAVFLGQLPAAQPPAATVGVEAEALPPYFHLLLVPFLIAWIGALALSRRGLARTLSTRTMVLGGFISYSLYMTHLVWFGLWRAGMSAVGIDGGALYAIGLLGLVIGALGIAWLMWRFIEEPAREWLRALTGARRAPTEEAGERLAVKAGGDSAEPIMVNGDEDGGGGRQLKGGAPPG